MTHYIITKDLLKGCAKNFSSKADIKVIFRIKLLYVKDIDIKQRQILKDQ